MPIINTKSDEFADLVMAYLMDMARDPDNLPDNDRFKEFIKIFDARGLETICYGKYLKMSSETRIKYKRMKPSVIKDGASASTTRIQISQGDTPNINEENEFDRELCKKIFRKIKEVRFKHPSKVLTEDRIDKIIDYCVEQHKKQQEEQENG